MSRRLVRTALAALALVTGASASAQSLAPPPAEQAPIDATQRREVVAALGRQLEANYVFADVATALAARLRDKEAAGGYAAATDTRAFGEALAADLQSFGKDAHFQVGYLPPYAPEPGEDAEPPPPDAAAAEAMRREAARNGFGVEKVERLPGNIGLVELRGFGYKVAVGEAISQALQLLQGTDAMIVDLRRNGGGEPETVAWLLSHFFAADDPRHLLEIRNRTSGRVESYSTGPAPIHYQGPVRVLVSARTFSAGEQAAYDFQVQKRGLVVGEKTAGAANPGRGFDLGHGFAAFIPDEQVSNPVTGTNWEHVGVQPDVAVPAAGALHVAHVELLRDAIAKSTDARQRARLEAALKKLSP